MVRVGLVVGLLALAMFAAATTVKEGAQFASVDSLTPIIRVYCDITLLCRLCVCFCFVRLAIPGDMIILLNVLVSFSLETPCSASCCLSSSDNLLTLMIFI